MNELTKKDLLKLPVRDWQQVSNYDSILVVPSGKKHCSGYHLMAVVGVRGMKPVEIAAYCDDISWIHKTNLPTRTDMPQRARICHIWGNWLNFTVGISCSSTDITITDKRDKI
jgi:hypothetical protein